MAATVRPLFCVQCSKYKQNYNASELILISVLSICVKDIEYVEGAIFVKSESDSKARKNRKIKPKAHSFWTISIYIVLIEIVEAHVWLLILNSFFRNS